MEALAGHARYPQLNEQYADLVHRMYLDLPGQIRLTDPNAPAKPSGFYRLLNSTGL